jgi:hypothetical protein
MPRRRLFIGIRSVVIAVLLLVPLLSSRHHHAADAATQSSCAVCLVAHHAPGVVAPATAGPEPALANHTAVSTSSDAPTQRVHSPIAGRAPPSFSSLAIS